MYYPEEILEQIRNANDIVDVISGYVKLTKKGASYFGLCPFHSEKTPSFSVSRSKQIFYCFGCHAGGNVISFIMQYENYTFDEAVKMLAERAGIKLPEIQMSSKAKEDRDVRIKLLEMHKLAANYYYRELTSGKSTAGIDYFHNRKLTDETIRHFGLGFTGIGSNKLYQLLKEKGYNDELIKLSGLVTIEEKGAHDKFWNRVMFPLMDVNNKVIGFGGRVLGDGMPKYMNSPETKIFEKNKFLFGLNYARKTRRDFFFLCEGNMDVVMMHQAGFTNTVATCGTSLTANQPNIIKRYVNKVILMYDSDAAGVAAAQRAIPMLNDAGISVKILDLSPCKDPDELLKTYGPEEMEKRVNDAENSFIWNIGVLKTKYDMQDPQQKTEFEHKTAEALCSFSEALERDNYIRAVSQKFMIPYDELKKLVNTLGNKGYGKDNNGYNAAASPERQMSTGLTGGIKKADDGLMKTQSFILASMANSAGSSSDTISLNNQISKYLTEDDFEGDIYKEIYRKLCDGNDSAKIIDDYISDEDTMKSVAQILNYTDDTEGDEVKSALATAIVRIKQAALERANNNATDLATLQNVIKEQAVWKNKKIVLK